MKTLMLIDGNSLMFRAYYATAYTGNLMKTSQGTYTNALFGFINMMKKVMENYDHTHVLVAFDAGKTTFRHEFLETYKDGRKPMPDELRSQINLIKKYLDLLGVKRLEIPTFEADDIIGTLAKQGEGLDFGTIHLITGDKDLLQLATDKTIVHITRKGVTEMESFTPAGIFSKYELSPAQIVDLKGLMGDPSDNLPGIPGVGEKTAIKLLKQYHSVEGLLQHTDQLKGKMKEKVEENRDQALLCKQMATIHCDVPSMPSFDELEYTGPDTEGLAAFFKEMEFNTFLKNLLISQKDGQPPQERQDTSEFTYEKISAADELEGKTYGPSSLHVEIFEDNYHDGTILGIAVVNETGAYYTDFETAVSSPAFMGFLKDPNIPKKIFDSKRARVALLWQGHDLQGVTDDLLLMTYILSPSHATPEFKKIALHFEYDGEILYDEEVYGKGAKRKIADADNVGRHSLLIARGVSILAESVRQQLEEQGQLKLYETLELPLAYVLADMEFQGMQLDLEALKEMGSTLQERIITLESDIHSLAGQEFKISSPKQLGEILFEKLGMNSGKKTKTGYSTSADVLEKLKDHHPIIEKILEYRTLTKLHSTYITGLIKSIYPDGKVHTIFNQALTQTGRLSSVDPNLQNIPIRLEEGRLIRKAFIPSHKDWVIVGADYSQIELRILAHISETRSLIAAFIDGEDIHTKTAMDVFKLDETQITADHRRNAKAINFGIIYGMSAFGLSENLNITQKEAGRFIDNYLETYSGIKKYMEDTVQDAKFNGYVSTLFNRRRYIPELAQKNRTLRQFGERTAMNAPIQGSAADIIKKAMIDVAEAIVHEKMESRLLLQVHDELVLEVPKQELDRVIALVTETMEQVAELKVPLKADYSFGPTWYDAK